MLSRRLISIIISFAGTPALAGVFAQSPAAGDDALSGLVKVVGGYGEAEVIFPGGEMAAPEAIPPEVGGALDGLFSISALDFVTSIYESNDFYESGYWGKDGTTFSSDIYTGRLPDYTGDDFVRPVAGGRLTSQFGYRESFKRMHKGVDISLREGDEVVAALPGVVGRIGYEPGGYGHFVIVVHSNGVETRYAHLSRVTASAGQRVAAGDPIALGGNTGNSTGPHLHFEIRKQGKALDPLSVFNF